MTTAIWLRAESKPGEERTALTPEHARQLMEAGYRVIVEDSATSAFATSEYRSVGCEIAPAHAWWTEAPHDAWILGLKELPSGDTPLVHKHIHFAHVYKNQAGWEKFLQRFATGGGQLYDLEFLVDENGRRVAAFGHWAGFAGAAVALMAWSNHMMEKQPVLGPITSSPSRDRLVEEVKRGLQTAGQMPSALVVGARGRAGQGAVECLRSVDVTPIEWDLEETRRGGPFPEILDVDIFLNCVFVEKEIPPFLTPALLQQSDRKLSVISDISCDPYGAYNPIPIYDRCTTFAEPVHPITVDGPPLYLIAIDHLPSMLPRESSEDFCQQLTPYLTQLSDDRDGVWGRAHDLFVKKMAAIPSAT